MIYMNDPNDLDKTIEAAIHAQIGHKLSDRKTKNINLAKQVEQFQAQIAELMINNINNSPNY